MSDITTQREGDARAIIKAKMAQVNALVGNDPKKASAYGSALASLANNKNIKECSVESIMDVGLQIVQAGLNPNPLFNEAYVVPFKAGNTTVAQLQVGVKGYVTLAYRAGWVVKSRIVYKCDEFSVDYAEFDEKFHHVPNLEKQDNSNPVWIHKNIVGVIVMAKDGLGNVFKQFVPNSKIEQIRLKSQNQKNASKYDYIWATWAEEMVQAKAVKYVLKRLPISDDFMTMAIADELHEREDERKVKQISSANDIFN